MRLRALCRAVIGFRKTGITGGEAVVVATGLRQEELVSVAFKTASHHFLAVVVPGGGRGAGEGGGGGGGQAQNVTEDAWGIGYEAV
jgi:hypothetical protein